MAEPKTVESLHPLPAVRYRRFDITSADLVSQLLRDAHQDPALFDLDSTRIETDQHLHSTISIWVREM